MALADTLSFLTELSNNNNKEWFDLHRKRYQTCRMDFISLVGNIIEEVSKFDPSLSGVDPKKCVFRINRDIRFSKDKTPYKTNFGALMGSNGKKTEGTGFYIHISPGQIFAGGGMYMPPKDKLAAIRQEIDYNPETLKAVIENQEFIDTFGEIQGDQLKTAPKGYPKDHPNIALLRYKSFYVVKEFADTDVLGESFFSDLIATYQKADAFNQYLKGAIE